MQLRKRASQGGVVSTRHLLRTSSLYQQGWGERYASKEVKRADGVPTVDGYFDESIRPKPNPIDFIPPVPYVPPEQPPFSPVFPSGMRFVAVPWTFQKAKDIKKRRFELALGAFKMGYEVPYLAAYRDLHERKSKQQAKRDKKEAIEEARRDNAFRKSLKGYEESWRTLWRQQVSNAYLPYPDPPPTEAEWSSMLAKYSSDEFFRPYSGLPLHMAIDKFIKEEWGQYAGPVARTFGDFEKKPGLERRFHPYLDDFAFYPNMPDPWGTHNFWLDDMGVSYPDVHSSKLGSDDDEEEGDDDEDEDEDEEVVEDDAEGEEEEAEDGEELEKPGLVETKLRRVGAGGAGAGAGAGGGMAIDPKENRGNPEELVDDFRQIIRYEQAQSAERNPLEVPPGARTAEEKQKVIEDREIFRTFHELRSWIYMRKKLAEHGLMPERESVLLYFDEDDDDADDARQPKELREDEEDAAAHEKARRIITAADLKAGGFTPEEDIEEKDTAFLKALNQLIDIPSATAVPAWELREKLVLAKKETHGYMKEVVSSERKPPAPRVKEYPLEITTNYSFDPDVLMGALARKKFIERKAILRVHVPSLGLPKPVVERLKLLTGSRFNEETQVLKLVGDKHENKRLNTEYVQQLLRELIGNAMLADPNYVPISDLSADIKTLIPSSQLPEDLEEDLAVLTAPPLMQEELQSKKKKEWNYRLFHFNFYKPMNVIQREKNLRNFISKAYNG